MPRLVVRKYCYSLKRKGIIIFETKEGFSIGDHLDGRRYEIPHGEVVKKGLKIQLQCPITTYLLQ